MHLKHPQSADKNTVFLDCVAYIKPFQTTTRARQVIAPLVERRHGARSVPLAQAHFLEVATESRVRAENPKLQPFLFCLPDKGSGSPTPPLRTQRRDSHQGVDWKLILVSYIGDFIISKKRKGCLQPQQWDSTTQKTPRHILTVDENFSALVSGAREPHRALTLRSLSVSWLLFHTQH